MLLAFLCKQYDRFSNELDCDSQQMRLFSKTIFKTTLLKFWLFFFKLPASNRSLCYSLFLSFFLLSILDPLVFIFLKLTWDSTVSCFHLVSDIQVGGCVCTCTGFACDLASFLFLYLWLFIASIRMIMGPAVLLKAKEEFALNSNKGSGNVKCGMFHLLHLFFKTVHTCVSVPNN